MTAPPVKRVLVTGGSGLIGRPTVLALKEAGFQVVALSRTGPVAGADETLTADILDKASRRAAVERAGASHLLHLAWHGGDPAARWHGPENIRWAAATLDLVDDFARAGGRRVLAVGSCAEYDWSRPLLREDTPLNPASTYGRAKVATVRALQESAPALGLSLAWARLFFCYGPGEPAGRLLGDLLEGLAAGRPVPCTDGLQERDYLHSHDIARALVTVLQSDHAGPINIGSGTAIAVRDLIGTAARLMGRPELIRLGEIPRPATDPPRLVAEVSTLRALGFEARIDLETGLRICIDAMAQEARR